MTSQHLNRILCAGQPAGFSGAERLHGTAATAELVELSVAAR